MSKARRKYTGEFKREWTDGKRYRTRAEARTDIFFYIEGFYNQQRLHSTLGYLPPAQFEQRSV